MEEKMRDYRYDAFISYRHLPLDEAVASRVQNLLERYRPPKHAKTQTTQIKRVFRDKTELPTSGDLDQSLKDALLHSRFLIVILSEETRKSKWCMEEIRAFKEAHGGSMNRILPVLVSGEPHESIPEILLHETRGSIAADGTRTTSEIEIEPLCCDVRAKSTRKSLQKLNVEFLRLAAPMLGCGFDDLFQRHMRRRKRMRTAVLTSAFVAMACVISVISVFAYRTYVAQQRYFHNLEDSYTRQGAEQLQQGKSQEALMYYGSALGLDSGDQAAKTGALLLLQRMNWLNDTERREGLLIGGRVVKQPSTRELAGVDEAQSRYLYNAYSDAVIEDAEGNEVSSAKDWGRFAGGTDSGSCWYFMDEQAIRFYMTQTGEMVSIERPIQINALSAGEFFEPLERAPSVGMLSERRAAVAYGGYLYLYDLSTGGKGKLLDQFDLAQVFPEVAEQGGLSGIHDLWTDEHGSLLIVTDGASTATFDADARMLRSVSTRYGCWINDVAFSAEGDAYALVYGNDMGIALYNPGGFVEIYDDEGRLRMQTDERMEVAPTGAAFSPNGEQLLVWGSATLQVWDIATGRLAASPLQANKVVGAAWLEDGRIAVDEGDTGLHIYEEVRFAANERDFSDIEPSEPLDARDVKRMEMEDGTALERSYTYVQLMDAQGNVMDEAPCTVNRMLADARSGAAYLWYDGENVLYRCSPDGTSLCMESLDTRGWKITEVYTAGDGVVAVTGNGYLLYYAGRGIEPSKTLLLGQQGIVRAVAADDSGLMAVVIRTTTYKDRTVHHFEDAYAVELWDLNMGIRLANLEEDGAYEPKYPVFTEDGWLVYWKQEEPVGWLLDSMAPDGEALALIQALSCFTLDESQAVRVKRVQTDLDALGNWSDSLTVSRIMPHQKELGRAERIAEKMRRTLEEEGPRAWIAAYDQLWKNAEAESLLLGDMLSLFNNYIWTAFKEGLQDELRVGATCMRDVVFRSGNETAGMSFDMMMGECIIRSDRYDDLIIAYWLDCADRYEQSMNLEEEDWFQKLQMAFTLRLEAGLLAGKGEEAFAQALGGLSEEYLPLLLTANEHLYPLIQGEAKEAAAASNQNIEQYKMDGAEDKDIDDVILSYLLCATLYMERGFITEECFSEYADNLVRTVGLKLTQLSKANMDAGLRMGDIVLKVNDVRLCTQPECDKLQKRYPTAKLTVQRGSQVFETEVLKNWKIVGEDIVF